MVRSPTNISSQTSHPAIFTKARLWFLLLAGALIAAAVYYLSEIQTEVRLLRRVDWPWLVTALACQLLTYGFTAMMYRGIVRACDRASALGIASLYRASLISLFFNQVLPSAGVSGNAFLIRFLTRAGVRPAASLATVVVDLLSFYLAVELIIAGCGGWLVWRGGPGVFSPVFFAGAFLFGLFATAIIVAARPAVMSRFLQGLKKRRWGQSTARRIEVWMASFPEDRGLLQALWRHYRHARHGLPLVGLQAGIFFLDGLSIFSLARGLGWSVAPHAVALCLTATKIVSVLPFAPGALVLYESSLVFFLSQFRLPVPVALMVTLLFRFLSFWLPIPFGLVLYQRWLAKKPL